MKELSIIIPSRNELFLSKTIEDVLAKSETDLEVIAVLDGAWSNPAITQNKKVNVIYVKESLGQRRATNLGVKLSRAKYIMKIDAHCGFDQGFDRKMLEGFTNVGDDVTMVPIMRNLWAYDWKCYSCGWKKYQCETPIKCDNCGGTKIRRKMMWVGKERPQSTSYCFDSEPHFQYFNAYTKRTEYQQAKKTGFTETMSLQGSCFMTTREKYLDLELCGEDLGSWGNQGIEVACKTWLSGGRVLCNHNTWYAHMFRKGGDFGFPYPLSGNEVKRTKNRIWELIKTGKCKNQVYPVSWLIKKFWPVTGWTEEALKQL